MDDPHDLARFVEAQAPVFERVLRELGAGRKESHWMWFVFPQIAGLGHSPMAQRYAIGSLDEAEAYLGHDLLGARLAQCTDLVNRITGRSILSILGRPDDMKFRSSMTLFSRATADDSRYRQALDTFFEGKPDPATIERLYGATHPVATSRRITYRRRDLMFFQTALSSRGRSEPIVIDPAFGCRTSAHQGAM